MTGHCKVKCSSFVHWSIIYQHDCWAYWCIFPILAWV